MTTLQKPAVQAEKTASPQKGRHAGRISFGSAAQEVCGQTPGGAVLPGQSAAARGPAPSMAEERRESPPPAWAYMVRCADGSLYSGWTNDLARRVNAHRTGHGARYTRGFGAQSLAYAERCADRSTAMRREAQLKRLDKPEKERLAAAWARESSAVIRPAAPADAADIAALYNWYVTHDTATFQYGESDVRQYTAQISGTQLPFLAAFHPDGSLCGYACAHPWHDRDAYSWDAETTIYLAPGEVGQGLGRRLYTALLEILKLQGYYNAVAQVAHPNPASEAFHRAMGFERYGFEPRTGYKFGQWLGLTYWLRPLHPGTGCPKPVNFAPDPARVAAILQKVNGAAQ
jgi:L-amino acid N-acyltransferase YncA/predicted GIY-YIG superfamily endonuclease